MMRRDASCLDFEKRSLLWQGIWIPFTNETVSIPGRSCTVFPLKILNTHVAQGYVPRIDIYKGVCLGDALVTKRDGKAYVRIINTNKDARDVSIPAIEIQEVDFQILPFAIPRRNRRSSTHADKGS